MALGLFRRRPGEAAGPAIAADTPVAVDLLPCPDPDPARDILELLELELGGLIRQLEKAAGSVSGGGGAAAAPRGGDCARPPCPAGRPARAPMAGAAFSPA